MSKMSKLMAAAMMMGAMASGDFGTVRGDYHKNPYEGETEDERRRRIHKMYGDNSKEHEFVIKGEHIMAKDKRTAMKIYANRHTGKKRKNK